MRRADSITAFALSNGGRRSTPRATRKLTTEELMAQKPELFAGSN